MTRDMSNSEILATLVEMLDTLRKPDPDPMLFWILQSRPMNATNFAKLLGATAVKAAFLTLHTAGVDPAETDARANVVTVRMGYHLSPDDVPDWEKVAGTLTVKACDFLLSGEGNDGAAADALTVDAVAAAARGAEFSLLTLAELLGHIRRLFEGDTRGVMIR